IGLSVRLACSPSLTKRRRTLPTVFWWQPSTEAISWSVRTVSCERSSSNRIRARVCCRAAWCPVRTTPSRYWRWAGVRVTKVCLVIPRMYPISPILQYFECLWTRRYGGGLSEVGGVDVPGAEGRTGLRRRHLLWRRLSAHLSDLQPARRAHLRERQP